MTCAMTKHSSLDVGTLPYWTDSASLPTFSTIDRDIDVDVAVIGGGITGLTTAYLLLSAGKSVAILERGRCASIDTGHTTAHLTMVTDTRLSELVSRFGRSHAQAVWDAGLAAIDQIDAIVRANDIDCAFEWVDGYLHAPNGESNSQRADEFRNEASLARDLEFDAAFVEPVPFSGGPGIRFVDQARFHPLKYLAGLANAIRAKGGAIYEQSGAEEFLENPLRVKANSRRVRCRDIVIASHNPLVGVAGALRSTVFQTKLALYTSYVIAGRVRRGRVPDALFWDTNNPYQYLRIDPQREHDLVILGGEDHKTGQASDTNACHTSLEQALLKKIPEIVLTHRWSGQVIETPDGLPYIGKMADHQYAATGFAGNGMTFGTLAAIMIADAIQGRRNPWAELFDPGRAAIRHGLWDYLKENTDYPYYMMRRSVGIGDEPRSLRAVKPGQGKIVQQNGDRVAAYRRPDGSLTLLSATCTHMGCIVGWNDAERTWDCPCHGSRFTAEGEVISGPAQAPLPARSVASSDAINQ
jgi:glycine/D-amino acid oxidase-like deaminating enzyme/nitrite reductase/ring-hydroxylating ferredoxin subunit